VASGDVAAYCFFYHLSQSAFADRHLRVGSLRQPWEGNESRQAGSRTGHAARVGGSLFLVSTGLQAGGYSIVVEFILRETAVYQRGTDTRTETQDKIVQEFHLLGQNYQAGQAFQKLDVTGSCRWMHTFVAQHNKVQWILKFHLKIARWPDITEEYELQVIRKGIVSDGGCNYSVHTSRR